MAMASGEQTTLAGSTTTWMRTKGGEQLSINVDGRNAEKGDIIYTSDTWSSEFKYEPWGAYKSIALMGKHYLVGYPASIYTKEISSLRDGEFREVLIDDDDVHMLNYSEPLPLLEAISWQLKRSPQRMMS